jgi:hypothetical protein
MATTRRKRPATAQVGTSKKAVEPIELVVRRGALWRFNTLKKKTSELPVTVLWDRRQSDRRRTGGSIQGERRASERRQKPPFTWELADFVVVGQTAPRQPAKAKPRRNRKKSA